MLGVLGLVVAGRFWCSYAWVSLTQTAPVRPRGCMQACVLACVCACVRLCVRVLSVHRRVRVPVGVPVGGVLLAVAVCGVVWRCGACLFSLCVSFS